MLHKITLSDINENKCQTEIHNEKDELKEMIILRPSQQRCYDSAALTKSAEQKWNPTVNLKQLQS